MKELSIEQKAKHYDKAIERANSLLSSNQLGNAWIYKLLPELKKSEDERIRKDIIVLIKDWWDRVNKDNISTKEQMLAWLEKQSAKWSEEDLRHKSWILECLADGERKVPQYAEDFRAAYKWLESLRSQPHWKPSEEQMEALENSTALTEEQGEALYSLVQDLKKL